MEQEPRQNQPRFRLQFESGVEYLCYRNNTDAYLHSEEPDGDHFYHRAVNPEDSAYIFREQIPNFDELVKYMANNDFEITQRQRLDDHDREVYERYLELTGRKKPVVEPENTSYGELDWISPRKEQQIKNAVGFLIYLAQHDKL